MNDLAIFVDSYDANSDLWDNVFSIMDYYWKECCFQKYLVTNSRQYAKHNVKAIPVGKDTDWLVCTLKGLKQIEEPYVFFMFEDYYFSKAVTNDQFISIIHRMKKDSIFFYRLSLINGLDKSKTAVPVSKDFPYAINLQPAIWKKEILIQFLEEMRKEGVSTPWQFEFYFIDRQAKGNLPVKNGMVEGVLYDTRDIIGYQNAIIQGKWVRGVVKRYKNNHKILFTTGNRPYMSMKDEIWDSVKQFGHKIIPYRQRERIKKFLRRINIKFMR